MRYYCSRDNFISKSSYHIGTDFSIQTGVRRNPAGLEAADRKLKQMKGDGMKNGKKPTLKQKQLISGCGLVPDNWLVVKDQPDTLEVISRASLKKVGKRPRTRRLLKQ